MQVPYSSMKHFVRGRETLPTPPLVVDNVVTCGLMLPKSINDFGEADLASFELQVVGFGYY